MKLFIAFLIFTAALIYGATTILDAATAIASSHNTSIQGVQ